MDQQDALQNLLLQFVQGQVDLQNSLQALADVQQGLGAAPPPHPWQRLLALRRLSLNLGTMMAPPRVSEFGGAK